MAKRILLQELTRTAANTAAKQGALIVLPMGAIEQHGPHLPVGTDTITIEHLARNSAEKAQKQIPVIVAPTLPFGSSHHHLPFGGTMSLGSDTYYRTVCELVVSLIQGGFSKLFLLNGHGGNHELLQLVARDLALEHEVSIAAASYWTIAWDELIALEAHVDCRFPGHAGKFETSNMLVLEPDLIQEPLPHRDHVGSTDPRGFVRPYRAEHSGAWQKVDGYSDSPDQADVALGTKWLNATIESVSKAMIEFHKQADEARQNP